MPVTTLYHFIENVPSSRWPAHISIVRAVDVYASFSRTELSDIFGGMARYVNDKTGEEWIGIWSARKASKFRRLLRERGWVIVIVKSRPVGLHMKTAFYGRRSDAKGRPR